MTDSAHGWAEFSAEDALGKWAADPWRHVRLSWVENDGDPFHQALAYDKTQRAPVSWGVGDTQVEALRDLAERGRRRGRW